MTIGRRRQAHFAFVMAIAAFGILAFGGLAARVAADCPDEWYPIFGVTPGTNGEARAATLWDPDGDGPLPPQPVVGGLFSSAGGIGVNRIARFDGNIWLPFGSGSPTGVSGNVLALTTWDSDGVGPLAPSLVAAGEFTHAGGTMVNRIAVWNGSAWQSLGGGFASFRVSSIVSWDPDDSGPMTPRLVAGGVFSTTTAGATVNRVAMWDGAAWQPLGNGFASGDTAALCVYDPDGSGPMQSRLVAGGTWTVSGMTTVNRVAWWDGVAWQPFGTGLNDVLIGLTAWDSDGPGPLGDQVVAIGGFSSAGGTSVVKIARWDGSAWHALSSGIGSTPFCIGTWDPDASGPMPPEVVVGGSFTFAGGPGINRMARWNGSAWQSFGTGMPSGIVYALTNWDPDESGPLISAPLAVGNITTAGTRQVSNVASWQGSDWRPLGNGINASVTSLTKWDSDGPGPLKADLVAAGGFTIASGKTVNRIARFDGVEWHPLATGLNGSVWEVTTWDPDGGGPLNDEVVAVGDFLMAGSTTVNRVARFDGIQWQSFGAGIGAHLGAVTVWDLDGPGGNPGKVIVGGTFSEAAGQPGNRVAMWDGNAWQRMSDGFIDEVMSLAAFSPTGNPADTRIYAGGSFGLGGAPPFSLIAQWNGSTWESMHQGVDSYPLAMTVANDGAGPLVAGGAFNLAHNATIASRVAAWSGASWINMAFQPGLTSDTGSGAVYGLTSWDPDGPGPLSEQIIAGGGFDRTVSGPTPVLNSIGRWDGNSWEPLGEGMNDSALVDAVISWDPDGDGPQSDVLVAAGIFITAGGLPGTHISALLPCDPPCSPCDVNCDGSINGLDVQAFVDVVIGGGIPCSACGGDANGDTLVDYGDVADFIECLMM